MARKVLIIAALVFACIIGFLFMIHRGVQSPMVPGVRAADFQLKDVCGKTYQLSDFRGQTVVLNFFATWCPPCMDEASELEAFGNEVKDVQLIMIARGESKKSIKNYIEENDSKLLYLVDTRKDVSNMYGVTGQPETVIINGEGMIIARFSGPTTKNELIRLINE